MYRYCSVFSSSNMDIAPRAICIDTVLCSARPTWILLPGQPGEAAERCHKALTLHNDNNNKNNNNDDDDDNNNNNNLTERRNSRFFTISSLRREPSPTRTVCSSGQGAIVCKSRATCCVTCYVVRRDSSAIKFDRV